MSPMSKENVEVFRQFIDTWQKNVAALRLFTDAFHRRDLDALLSCCDPDIEIGSGGVLIGTPVYRGMRDWSTGLETWPWLGRSCETSLVISWRR
jgi:hypothetical protein